MTAKDFFDKYDGQGIDLLPQSRFVNPYVLCFRYYLQVLNSVISFVAIYMMHYFAWFQVSMEEFLHYQSVFRNSLVNSKGMIGLISHNMPAGFDGSSTFPTRMISDITANKPLMTVFRAKDLFAFLVAFVECECKTTVIALKNAFSRFIVAIAIAEPSSLRGWGLKGFRTLLTYIQHKLYYSTQCMEVSI